MDCDERAIPVVAVRPSCYLVAYAPADETDRTASKPWVTVSWLVFVEPLPNDRSRFISRFRSACSNDMATRLAYGPYVTEPSGSAMDRRMFPGVKERPEWREQEAVARPLRMGLEARDRPARCFKILSTCPVEAAPSKVREKTEAGYSFS